MASPADRRRRPAADGSIEDRGAGLLVAYACRARAVDEASSEVVSVSVIEAALSRPARRPARDRPPRRARLPGGPLRGCRAVDRADDRPSAFGCARSSPFGAAIAPRPARLDRGADGQPETATRARRRHAHAPARRSRGRQAERRRLRGIRCACCFRPPRPMGRHRLRRRAHPDRRRAEKFRQRTAARRSKTTGSSPDEPLPRDRPTTCGRCWRVD